MKYYTDKNQVIYAYAADGSQDHAIPEDYVVITEKQATNIRETNKAAAFASLSYVQKRLMDYPPVSEFIDAWVKEDATALEEYRQKCLAVKEKYPKP
jgi:hypothetical protein